VHAAIEMFTGNEVRAAEIQHLINHPANAINMNYDSYTSLDKVLAWGIEARSIDEVRVIRQYSAEPDIPSIVEIPFPCH
jgi:hypothetical protein